MSPEVMANLDAINVTMNGGSTLLNIVLALVILGAVIGGIYFTLDNKEFWDFEYVEAVRKVFVNAFESIKTLEKTNPAEYEKYYWRICDAYLENLYMQLQYYGAEYGADYCATAIDLFDKIIKKFGYEYMGEGTGKPLSTYIKTWRASYV